MNVELRPLSEVTDRAIDLLTRELGVADTLRFLMQFTSGEGNYTEERKALFADLTVDDIVEEMRKKRRKGNE